MDTLLRELRHAVRSLSRSPGLVLAVVLSLSLGIGANTTIFSLVNAVALRPLPADRPSELVMLYTSESSGERWGATSYPDYVDFRAGVRSLRSLAAYTVAPMQIAGDEGGSRRFVGALATGNFFTTLGVDAALGRTLQPADDGAPGASAVAVMSHSLWMRRFAGDPSAVGSTVRVNGHPFTVVGVLPERFKGIMMGFTPDLWMPTSMVGAANPSSDLLAQRGGRSLMVIGRLAPGVDVRRAQGELDVVMARLASEHAADSARVATVLPERDARVFPIVRGPVLGFFALLMIVVGLVLTVACVNVAGLMLARTTARRREFGIRLALGASRGRLVAQLMTECLLLSLIGGAGGFLLAQWGTDLLLAFRPPLPFDAVLDLRPDGRVLAFTTVVAVAASIVFGLAPALEAVRPDVQPSLRESAGGPRRSRLRNGLVVAQVAITVVLLVGAGLFVRGLQRARTLDPGFDPSSLVAMSFDLELSGYSFERSFEFQDRLLERLPALPGISSSATAEYLPLGLGWNTSSFVAEGSVVSDEAPPEVDCSAVSPGYFATLGIPMVRGREFSRSDRSTRPPVAIVNQTFAQTHWPNQDPIGRRITRDRSGESGWMEVVGVARDAKYRSLSEGQTPYVYLASTQIPTEELTLVARVTGEPRLGIAALRDALRSLDPAVPVFEIKTLDEHLGISLIPVRLLSTLLGGFGGLALVLAAVGLSGLVAFSASQRTREIGIRLALGAVPGQVLSMVLGQGMRLAVVGLVIGVALALATTGLIRNFLFGVSPADPLTFGGIVLLLGVVALAASWFPARRAARVDPMVALRQD